MFKIIAAATPFNVIGHNGKIPWHIPSELRLFKDLTINNTVIMGSTTFRSLNIKPLKNRFNVVLSKTLNIRENNVYTVASMEELLSLDFIGIPWVIGGANIYKQFYQFADEIFLSIIKSDYEGNTLLPEIPNDFHLEETIIEHSEFSSVRLVRYA